MLEQVWCHQPAKEDGHQAARSIGVTAKNARTGGAFSAPAHGRLGTLCGRISIGLWFWALDHAGTVNAPLCHVALATCFASRAERRRPLPVDALIPEPIFTSTHAITIDAPPERVWPWIAQMGAGRAGWYSWDAIDNGGTPSATSIMPAFQTVVSGDVMPAIPGATDAFVVAAVDAPRDLVLTVPDGRGGNAVAWEHVLDPLPGGRTRLIVRGRASSHWLDLARATPPAGHRRIFIERAYAALATLPRPLLIAFAALGHRIMEARHLRGIQRRSTAASARREVSGEAWRKALLVCGIASSLLYAAMIWAIRYEGYSPVSQVPSELTAIGAPTRTTLGAARADLHPAGRRLWLGRLAIRRAKSYRANRRRLDPGLRISWVPVAICPDASTRGAGRWRRNAERHHACRSRRHDGVPHVSRDRVWRDGIREAVPPLFDRQRLWCSSRSAR